MRITNINLLEVIFLIEWIFMDMGSTFINEEQCDNYRTMETLQQKNAPSKDEFLKKMSFYAKQNKDAYKCALKEFGLNKVHWHSEYENYLGKTRLGRNG